MSPLLIQCLLSCLDFSPLVPLSLLLGLFVTFGHGQAALSPAFPFHISVTLPGTLQPSYPRVPSFLHGTHPTSLPLTHIGELVPVSQGAAPPPLNWWYEGNPHVTLVLYFVLPLHG